MHEFLVHSIPGSPFGRAVLAALEEKRARYRIAAVSPPWQRPPDVTKAAACSRNEISDAVMNRLQREFDHEEILLRQRYD